MRSLGLEQTELWLWGMHSSNSGVGGRIEGGMGSNGEYWEVSGGMGGGCGAAFQGP